jgi:hypothetical protein
MHPETEGAEGSASAKPSAFRDALESTEKKKFFEVVKFLFPNVKGMPKPDERSIR